MASLPSGGKLYDLFTLDGAFSPLRTWDGVATMVGIALAMFVALFGFGAQYFGWSDPQGKVQMALFTTFILGVICGYKSN